MAPADITMTDKTANLADARARRSKLGIWISRAWRFRMGVFGGLIFALLVVMAAFAPWIQGSYSGVMGLPLAETAALLAAAGVEVFR